MNWKKNSQQNEDVNNRNSLVVILAIGIIIFIRNIFDTDPNLVYIVGGINVFACGFVICSMIENVIAGTVNKVIISNVPNQIQERVKKNLKLKIRGLCYPLVTVLIVLYFIFGCTNLGNDLISIVALGFSVLDDEIVQWIVNVCKV